MQDLRIYDFEFNLLAIETKLISSDWQIFFNDTGKAEIHISPHSESVPVLFDNKYLFITQGEKQAIVTAKQLGDDCVIYGKTPDWILSRRVILPQNTIEGEAETLLRDLAKNQAFEDETFFSLGDLAGVTKEIEIPVSKITSFSVILKDALSECSAGRRVYLDIANKKLVFEVLKGKELSLVISEGALNAYDTEYYFDLQNYFTSGAFSKEDGGVASVNSEEKTGIYKWVTPLASFEEADAKKEMLSFRAEEELSQKLKNLKFGKDYNLGDIVTVSLDNESLKRTKKYRIIGVELWEESQSMGERPIFNETEE